MVSICVILLLLSAPIHKDPTPASAMLVILEMAWDVQVNNSQTRKFLKFEGKRMPA